MKDINQELLVAFQAEHKEHLEHMRTLLAGREKGKALEPGPDLDEVFRRAHTLKGAARAVNLPTVQDLAHRLETLFSLVRQGALQTDAKVLKAVNVVLDSIEDSVAAMMNGKEPPDSRRAREALDGVLGAETGEPAAAAHPSVEIQMSRAIVEDRLPPESESPAAAGPVHQGDTLRVSAEGLDQLLRSSGELVTETLRQDQVARETLELERQFAELEQDWAKVRKAARSLNGQAGSAAQVQVVRYIDAAEERLRDAARQARTVRAKQQRSARSMRGLGEQLRQDVRRTRMVPAAGVFQGFRKMVRDLAAEQGKELDFHISGLDVEADRVVLQTLKDPLMHILRNAVSHGIESARDRERRSKNPNGRVAMRLEAHGNRLAVTVEDDGSGIDLKKVADLAVKRGLMTREDADKAGPKELFRLLFLPGFTTNVLVTELSGRGLGLSVVSEAISRLQGEVEITRADADGTSFLLSVPLSVSTHRLLLVECQGQKLGIPLHGIERLLRVKESQIETVERRPILRYQEQLVALNSLAHLLHLGEAAIKLEGETLPVVILKSGSRLAAVAVDAILTERDGLIQDLGLAAEDRKIAGAILLEDGAVSLVLNPAELVEALEQAEIIPIKKSAPAAPEKGQPTILVVDDSITTRTLEKGILETYGYRVRIAVDGQEGLTELRTEKIDLVIADVSMPVMDGFEMLEEMKRNERLSKIPVIMVTSIDQQQYRERGLALGASAYLLKQKFDQRELLETIKQLI